MRCLFGLTRDCHRSAGQLVGKLLKGLMDLFMVARVPISIVLYFPQMLNLGLNEEPHFTIDVFQWILRLVYHQSMVEASQSKEQP